MAARILRQHWRDRARVRFAIATYLLLNVPAAQADCIDAAAAFHRVNPSLLRAITAVESRFVPDAINRNTNGTEDIGLMQINSWWLPQLARYGITRESLFDPCTNVYVGAWILSRNFAQHGVTWTGVGAYHSPTPALQLRYANLVYKKLQQFSLGTDSSSRVPSDAVIGPRKRQTASARASSPQVKRASFTPSSTSSAIVHAGSLAAYEQLGEAQQ
ncbi:lytic transglycosylase domain-containing protein [Burkholderia cenocepacia]|uniref:lytic transglycosylase domain-containing protein n=1 Tax=Burkholderia cenocepacia TaxID=95486 RepID=UPI0022324AB0|nr:lytic transglycosylase domain-containing protein [Burkholderia cenocepacia]MCW3677848.1 lytic transglycosylase domain-containing protein [Burkholderia cenocepacia]